MDGTVSNRLPLRRDRLELPGNESNGDYLFNAGEQVPAWQRFSQFGRHIEINFFSGIK
jgi:hypothetical protein